MTVTTAQIVDVTARDGFQIVKDWIPTEFKKQVLDGLVAAGVKKIEATSFVSPKAVPQLADAADIVRHMRQHHPDVTTVALVPNLRGARNAAEAGALTINCVISASEEHNKNNIRRTHEESLNDIAAIADSLPQCTISVGLATTFGCPFVGSVPVGTTIGLIGDLLARGVQSVTLADTIGVANPRQVKAVIRAVRAVYPNLDLALHMHDTHGMGLANMAAALDEGVNVFETAAGGMGGCPFAPGAAGNTATEDTVNMLHRMGVETGIDLDAYLDVVRMIRENIPVPLPGRLVVARGFREFVFFDAQGA